MKAIHALYILTTFIVIACSSPQTAPPNSNKLPPIKEWDTHAVKACGGIALEGMVEGSNKGNLNATHFIDANYSKKEWFVKCYLDALVNPR